jgi:hypothetical protein
MVTASGPSAVGVELSMIVLAIGGGTIQSLIWGCCHVERRWDTLGEISAPQNAHSS